MDPDSRPHTNFFFLLSSLYELAIKMTERYAKLARQDIARTSGMHVDNYL
jgi:hypothetical protein